MGKMNRCNRCRLAVLGTRSICAECDLKYTEESVNLNKAYKDLKDKGTRECTCGKPILDKNHAVCVACHVKLVKEEDNKDYLTGSGVEVKASRMVGTCVKTTGLYHCGKCSKELLGPYAPCFNCNPMPKALDVPKTSGGKSKYHREILPGVWVDVYDVLAAFEVSDAGYQHAIKKMLATGNRGHKDEAEDRKDIFDSVVRSNERFELFNKGES